MDTLPITPVIPDIVAAVVRTGTCVLSAPPGAGKTSTVPLVLMDAVEGKILMLEPRRVAARAAAERLAEQLGESLGATVGLRMRGESIAGRRIEVVTDGVLTRMLQGDPGLDGVGCVIFDEFHERSLQGDLGLAFCLEARGALREDLKLVVMSATLDAGPVAALLGGAPVVEAEGRTFPVETIHTQAPAGMLKGREFERAVAGLVEQALAEQEGGVLVFLPGEGEIRRVMGMLDLKGVEILPLYGALPFKAQRAAIRPSAGRKVVLATSIAETSLTIEDVRVVVDGGKARRAVFDPGKGMSRLVTERVSRAEADQRRGRAGRLAPGACYRLWAKGEEGALAAFAAPEIATADLAGMALDMAMWGARGAEGLALLTPPPEGMLDGARALLRDLGALDAEGGITPHGRAMAKLPTHPRLAHMVLSGGPGSAALAALCEERGVLRQAPVDLGAQLVCLHGKKGVGEVDRGALARVREGARRLKRYEGGPERQDVSLSPGAQLSLAFPDRIALKRPGAAARYLLSGGAGAVLDETDPLAGSQMLVVSDLDGDRREARIRRALPVSEAEIRAVHGDRICQERVCEWDRREKRVKARARVSLGALVLHEEGWTGAPDADFLPALLDGVRDLGLAVLRWRVEDARLRERIGWLTRRGEALPDVSDVALLEELEAWLGPCLDGCRSVEALGRAPAGAALRAWLGYEVMERVDRLAPDAIRAATGTRLPVDYSGERPQVSVRLQEMLGVTAHPVVGAGREPVVIEFLSPARRPIQTTADLPAFWAGSYAEVRKEMRGRYPKHDWPENPGEAVATRRLKPR